MTPKIAIAEENDALLELDAIDVSNRDLIPSALRADKVVLIRHTTPVRAQEIMKSVTSSLGLFDSLELQAQFASMHGHRSRFGEYFMTVTNRAEHQYITPHSEGSSAINMELAAFYCLENTTDGGETLLFHVNGSGDFWQAFREVRRKGRIASAQGLPSHLTVRARQKYQIDLEGDPLDDNDQVLSEHGSSIPGLSLMNVLTKPRATYSTILQKTLFAFWATIGNVDKACASDYETLLDDLNLLRRPFPGSHEILELDTYADRRLWNSQLSLSTTFSSRIVLKLGAEDLLIQNNLSWAHAATNWSTGKGKRRMAAAFA